MTNNVQPPAIPPPPIHDGLTNVMTGLGTSKSKRSHSNWQLDVMGDFATLDAMYQSNWIARKIVDTKPEDMTREWRRIKCDGAEQIAALEQELLLAIHVKEATGWANLYGGAGILMLTDQDLTKPLDVNRIKRGSLKRLMVLDRYDLAAQSINNHDVLAANYLLPEYYTVRGGSTQVHHSHVARFTGAPLPLRYMAQTQGWGDSELRKCIEEITDMVSAKGGIAELMQEVNIDVIRREGLTDELSTDQDDMIIKRYEMFSLMKSTIQMALLDGGESGIGGETLERQTLNLSGVAPVIEQFMTWISGAADIPVTRMFGSSAKGMNATGEGDEKNYFNSIRALQRFKLAPPLRHLDEVLVRSALGNFPSDYDYVWNPLSTPDESSLATAEKARAEKHQVYLDNGIVTRSQVQRELQANEEYQFDEKKIDELEALEEPNMFDEPLGDDTTGVIDSGLNNGFASVKPSSELAEYIIHHMESIGIKGYISKNDLHVTLMYSKDENINIEAKPNETYEAYQIGEPEIIGNDPWRAMVIKLHSDDLHARFVELTLSGAKHSYDEFTPHLSLKYSPTENDLKLLMENPINLGPMVFTGEKFAPVK